MWKIVLGFVVFAALSLFVIFKSCDSFKLCEIKKIAPPVASHCASTDLLPKSACRVQQQSRF
jgi:hypothetical protein